MIIEMRGPKAIITNLCNNCNLRITPQFNLVQGQMFYFNAKGTRPESCMISTASQDFLGPEGFKGLLMPSFWFTPHSPAPPHPRDLRALRKHEQYFPL